MEIHYSSDARVVMRQARDRSENEFHSLRGLIILLSTAPMQDDRDKVEMDLGRGLRMLVYMGLDWWIAYQVDAAKEILSVVYIDAA